MDFETAKVRKFSSSTIATKEDDGIWKVITTMEEALSMDGETFEEKKLSMMGMNKDFQEAFNTAMRAILAEYENATGGMGSLFTNSKELNDTPQVNETVET